MARKHKSAGFRPRNAGNRDNEGGATVAKCPENAAADNGEDRADAGLRRIVEGEDWAQLMVVLYAAFAGMEGRIDPPSSLLRMQVSDLPEIAKSAEIWVIGTPIVATVTLTARPGALYIGKLAVVPDQQGRGLARRLVALAECQARALGLAELMLETRVELVENHALFRHLGFVETARRAHAGFDRPTTVEFRKAASAGAKV
jgi:ribosomal protein S18 acetylase RimI-like enzyme